MSDSKWAFPPWVNVLFILACSWMAVLSVTKWIVRGDPFGYVAFGLNLIAIAGHSVVAYLKVRESR